MFGDIRSGRGHNVRNSKTYFPKVLARQARAVERQEFRSKLSPAEQIAELDARLGKGVGAVKERARLAKQDQMRTALTVVVQKLTKEQKQAKKEAHNKSLPKFAPQK